MCRASEDGHGRSEDRAGRTDAAGPGADGADRTARGPTDRTRRDSGPPGADGTDRDGRGDGPDWTGDTRPQHSAGPHPHDRNALHVMSQDTPKTADHGSKESDGAQRGPRASGARGRRGAGRDRDDRERGWVAPTRYESIHARTGSCRTPSMTPTPPPDRTDVTTDQWDGHRRAQMDGGPDPRCKREGTRAAPHDLRGGALTKPPIPRSIYARGFRGQIQAPEPAIYLGGGLVFVP